MSSPQPPAENKVARSIALKNIIGSAEKIGSVGNRDHRYFFYAQVHVYIVLR
jgi:hypothetical protein